MPPGAERSPRDGVSAAPSGNCTCVMLPRSSRQPPPGVITAGSPAQRDPRGGQAQVSGVEAFGIQPVFHRPFHPVNTGQILKRRKECRLSTSNFRSISTAGAMPMAAFYVRRHRASARKTCPTHPILPMGFRVAKGQTANHRRDAWGSGIRRGCLAGPDESTAWCTRHPGACPPSPSGRRVTDPLDRHYVRGQRTDPVSQIGDVHLERRPGFGVRRPFPGGRSFPGSTS